MGISEGSRARPGAGRQNRGNGREELCTGRMAGMRNERGLCHNSATIPCLNRGVADGPPRRKGNERKKGLDWTSSML